MLKIKKIDFSRLRNNEHFELMRHVVNITTAAGADTLRVAPQLAALQTAFAQEDEALKKITKSALTKKIDEADSARDAAYLGLLNTVRAATTHFNPAAREVAERLMIVFDTYGNVARMAIEEETSAVYNLCKDLAEKYTADVQALGLSPWSEALDAANREVEVLMESRYEEGAGQSTLVMREVRAEVDAAYGVLADAVFAHGFVASLGTDATLTAAYNDVCAQWNEVIDRTENIVAVRRGRAAAEKAREGAENGGGDAPAPEPK